MNNAPVQAVNVRQVVPLLNVSDMAGSLAFYVDGLGFRMSNSWTPEGRLRWCWLTFGEASVMIQQSWDEAEGAIPTPQPAGGGVTMCLMCEDALAIWRKARSRGLSPDQPFVGNGLWVVSFRDPDGYRLDFESPTDVPEDTRYQGD